MRYAALFLIALPLAAQTRIASDFEIQQMERQIARSRDFISQLSGHLNLGDLRLSRNETALARSEYAKAYEIASNERLDARKASDLTRYATATSYAALAQAKLGDDAHAFALSEEAMRYTSDSAKSWNLYASTMSQLHRPAKAASAARNAVAIAEKSGDALDLAIDRYTLASSLIELRQTAEAERMLVDVVAALRSPTFASMQQNVQQHESFEIYSSARGDEAAYISILNRAQLRLARLYEDRGDATRARQQYENVLAARSDEPTALGGLARLATTSDERERYYADAFNANPFSLPLIRDYQRSLAASTAKVQAQTTGDQMRLALQQMQRGELTAARSTLETLAQKFPGNDTLDLLRREIDQRRAAGPVVLRANPSTADLRAIAAAFQDNRLTPEQRTQLDQMTFTSTATFETGSINADQTIFETGTIDGLAFRFSEPTAFRGAFAAQKPLRLTYRILGATRVGEADGLLLEPVRLEQAP